MTPIHDMARHARLAAREIATLPSDIKDAVLRDLASRIRDARTALLDANARDLDAARSSGLPDAKIRRLELSDAGLEQLTRSLHQLADMPDPVGQVTEARTTPSGLRVHRVRTPLGVIAMIYEARPGVTIDAFALCFKAGNACILKGGREAARSNQALASLAHAALEARGQPREALALFTSSDREHIRTLLTLSSDINLVIPRGGAPLIRFVREHSRIPTVMHEHGVCHAYVDADADLDMALNIVATAKAGAPATCNALECVLVHERVAEAFLPRLAERLARDGVEGRADEPARRIVHSFTPAVESDWGAEFLDLILAIRVVGSIDEAIEHIRRYASDHTETIITRDAAAADRFCRDVQSSCVLVNASTRFNDGFQLGLGAEIGISTSRVHAYGPMGLEGLTIERYVVRGDGQTR